jgi:hypothetical protein
MINIFFICLLIRLIIFYQKFAKKYPYRIAIELTGVKTKHEKMLLNLQLIITGVCSTDNNYTKDTFSVEQHLYY